MKLPNGFAVDWAIDHFGGIDLGDKRRNDRLYFSVAAMIEHPEGSLPAKFRDPAALDGFYRLMNSEHVTHDALIHAAARNTWRRMEEHQGTVLILHDDTVLDYSTLSIPDLGQVGNGNGRGLYAHNSLAITAEGTVLGLAGQLLHKRRKVKKTESRAARKNARDRESRLWTDACKLLPVAPEGKRWVDVADRGSDVMEFLAYEKGAGREYVVRSKHNRNVQVCQPDGTILSTKLHDYIRSKTVMSSRPRTYDLSESADRSARKVELSMSWAMLDLMPPRQPRGDYERVPLRVWVVRVWEANPPDGEKGIEWILLTNVEVKGEEDAWERVEWYIQRWKVEEWHKGMKTGMGIEDLQFTTRDSLEPAIAVLSVVALWLLEMRDGSRDEQKRNQKASECVPLLWVRVLSSWRHRCFRDEWTYGEFVHALARLGGHQNRKSDHPPGWIVLWRGWSQLQAMIAGAIAIQPDNCAET